MKPIKLRQLFALSSPFVLVFTLTGCGGGIGVSEYRPSEFNSHQRYDDTSVANYQEGAFPSYQISRNDTGVTTTTYNPNQRLTPTTTSVTSYSNQSITGDVEPYSDPVELGPDTGMPKAVSQ